MLLYYSGRTYTKYGQLKNVATGTCMDTPSASKKINKNNPIVLNACAAIQNQQVVFQASQNTPMADANSMATPVTLTSGLAGQNYYASFKGYIQSFLTSYGVVCINSTAQTLKANGTVLVEAPSLMPCDRESAVWVGCLF